MIQLGLPMQDGLQDAKAETHHLFSRMTFSQRRRCDKSHTPL
jgi:hypothetical protein